MIGYLRKAKAAPAFLAALANAPVSEPIAFQGGSRNNEGRARGPMGPHGFPGGEEKVVKAIADRIEAHRAGRIGSGAISPAGGGEFR